MEMRVRFVFEIISFETGFTIAKYRNLDTKDTVICKGYHLPKAGITYLFTVEETNDKKYGLQYQVISYKEDIELSKEGIIEYLSCGIIKGIGIRTAERIFGMFKEESLQVLSDEPEKLLCIKGITEKKLEKIIKSYNENAKYRDVKEFLIPYGFTPKQSTDICNFLKEDVLTKIKRNPYIVCHVRNITFAMAEQLKVVCGINDLNKDRLLASAVETIKLNMQQGAVGITAQKLLYGMEKLLRLPYAPVEQDKYLWKEVVTFIKNGQLSYRKILKNDTICQYIYLPEIEKVERELASFIADAIRTEIAPVPNIKELIDLCSNEVELDDSQLNAIMDVFSNNITILTGPPGSGKTTTLNVISKIQEHLDQDLPQEFMAPTGRAARKISENTQKVARTIHSRLKLAVHGEDRIYEEEEEEIFDSLVVIDEFSMVDMMLAHKFFKSLHRCRVVIVGDIDQLLSVGPGNVLRDMIASGMIPVAYLRHIHRQGEESLIIENALTMRDGITKFAEGNDFHIVHTDKEFGSLHNQTALKKLEDAMLERTLLEIKKYGLQSVVCICPYKKYNAGVYSMNKRIQQAVNPLNGRIEMKGLHELTFREGDLVMHLKNSEEAMNGDIGIVTRIQEIDDNVVMTAIYKNELGNDSVVYYDSKNIEEVTLAYAMTIHKCQGSEYDSVITCLTEFHKRMIKRNVLYTAVTRAKKNIILFSSDDVIRKAILNNSVEERYTLLDYNITQEMSEEYVQMELCI